MTIFSCACADVGSVLDTVLGGYAHTPGLRLTLAQACRIWLLGDARCQGVFYALVDSGFLSRGADGTYARVV